MRPTARPLVLLPLAACAVDVTLRGDTFDTDEGRDVVATLRRGDDASTDDPLTATVVDGGFEFVWTRVVAKGGSYTAYVYVDEDGDGACTEADHVFAQGRRDVPSDTLAWIHGTDPQLGSCEVDGVPLFP
jgi:hypothetical protein